MCSYIVEKTAIEGSAKGPNAVSLADEVDR